MHIDEYLSHAGKKGAKWGYSRGQLVDSSKVAKGSRDAEVSSQAPTSGPGLIERGIDAAKSAVNKHLDEAARLNKIVSDAGTKLDESTGAKILSKVDDAYSEIKNGIANQWDKVTNVVRDQEDRWLSEKQLALIEKNVSQTAQKSKTEIARQLMSVYDGVMDAKNKALDKLPFVKRDKMQEDVASLQRDILRQNTKWADRLSDTTIKVGNFKKDTTDKVSNFVNKIALAMDHKSAVKPAPKSKTERAAEKLSNIFDKASDKMGPAIKAAKGVAKDAKAATRELKFTIGRTIDDVFNTKRKQKRTALGRR